MKLYMTRLTDALSTNASETLWALGLELYGDSYTTIQSSTDSKLSKSRILRIIVSILSCSTLTSNGPRGLSKLLNVSSLGWQFL